MSSITVTDAFQSLLKTLCLQEFPCGRGKWRKEMTVKVLPMNYGKKVIKIMDKTEPQFSVTLDDYDASKSHIEILQEFVTAKHSPWTFDYSWSDEAKSLREIAVRSPELISNDFIHKHFVTLRLTDKGISEVDEKLLKFSNLEYLTLSANYIKNVNSKNLPRKLVSLELNSNQVSELFSLCVDPPALVHLGLGCNCLAYVDDYLSGDHWPALLSLDLSYNNLTDLPECLRKLKTLPNLRNLILMGNPLMLTPGYRGFVIDNLKNIDLLDDTRIEADERHRYSQMEKLTEQELSQCKVKFHVKNLRNVPKPLELQNPEEQPEYPIITRNYFVDFHYIEEVNMSMDVFNLNMDTNFTFNPMDQHDRDMSSRQEGSQTSFSAPMSDIPMEDNNQGAFFTSLVDDNNANTEQNNITDTSVIRSDKYSWSDDIELNWTQNTIRDDLLAVRDFLQRPMKIDVVEETILSYPKEEEGSEKSSSAKKKKEPEQKKDDKKGKKKKDNDQDMRHDPPQFNVVASFNIKLEQFLSGENFVNETLIKNLSQSRLPSGYSQPPSSAGGAVKEKTRNKSGDKKLAKDGKQKEPASQDGRKKSGKKEAKKKEAVEVETDPNEPPPPLEVEISVSLLHWTSTAESIQAEE